LDQVGADLVTVIERDGIEVLRMLRSEFLKLRVVVEAAEAIGYEAEVAEQIARDEEEQQERFCQ
jgi:hypothetical protein